MKKIIVVNKIAKSLPNGLNQPFSSEMKYIAKNNDIAPVIILTNIIYRILNRPAKAPVIIIYNIEPKKRKVGSSLLIY